MRNSVDVPRKQNVSNNALLGGPQRQYKATRGHLAYYLNQLDVT